MGVDFGHFMALFRAFWLIYTIYSPWRVGVDLNFFLALFTALRLKVGFWTIFEISCTSDLLNFALLIFSIPKRSFWI